MKKELEKRLFEEEPDKAWESRVFREVDSILDEKAARVRSGLLDWIFRPAFGLGLAAAGATAMAVVVLRAPSNEAPVSLAMVENTDMVKDADMLLNLAMLKEWPALEKMEKKKEWKKKRG